MCYWQREAGRRAACWLGEQARLVIDTPPGEKGISLLARSNEGLCPSTPPPFEKGGRKLHFACGAIEMGSWIVGKEKACCETRSRPNLLEVVVFQELIIGGETVNAAVLREDNDAVGNGLDELMVMGGKEENALEGDKAIVHRSDGFQV